MWNMLGIALGGAIGAVARHLLATWIHERGASDFPWGTLAVNVLGSFALAALMAFAGKSDVLSPTVRSAIGVGLLGGFTTYSTFNFETLALAQRGAWASAIAYVVAMLVGSFLAAVLGWFAARALLAP